MDARNDQFWNELEIADPLNQVIWDESPSVQLEIAAPEELRAVGAIGAQQAMIELSADNGIPCLPWVPDLLVGDWQAPSAILIVGSAYAGFIREYSGGKGMPLSDYVNAYEQGSVKLFFDSFRKNVIVQWSYYDFIRSILNGLRAEGDGVTGFALFDVCRASFVCRGATQAINGSVSFRKDKGGDQIVRRQPNVFAKYVESSKPNEWLWRRIQGSKASRVLALGTIAEHALLRCFGRNVGGDHLSIRSLPDAHEPRRVSARSDWRNKGDWALHYADDRHQLSHWEKNGWWEVQQTGGKDKRLWQLLPARHPASRGRAQAKDWMVQRMMLLRPQALGASSP